MIKNITTHTNDLATLRTKRSAMTARAEITEEAFMKVAEAAAHDSCLKQREGQFGTEWGILLNGHLMMSSTVDIDGERHYWSHM
ncbi:MAG: hypothetical protein JKY50_19410 [Oleispira sp.]|nr:hypothetical protein [Oleispira sp.]